MIYKLISISQFKLKRMPVHPPITPVDVLSKQRGSKCRGWWMRVFCH